jgi:hypothetical protein
VDPVLADEGVKVKKNVKKILKVIEETICRILYDDNGFPLHFITILRRIDSNLSMKFSVGNVVIGGLLFLRLINPAVIFPQEYGLIDKRID